MNKSYWKNQELSSQKNKSLEILSDTSHQTHIHLFILVSTQHIKESIPNTVSINQLIKKDKIQIFIHNPYQKLNTLIRQLLKVQVYNRVYKFNKRMALILGESQTGWIQIVLLILINIINKKITNTKKIIIKHYSKVTHYSLIETTINKINICSGKIIIPTILHGLIGNPNPKIKMISLLINFVKES